MATEKHIYARVSSSSGDFITVWQNISFGGFQKNLNGGLGECVITLALPFDYDANDLVVGNDVQLQITDGGSITGGSIDDAGALTIYRGYISLLDRGITGTTEYVRVHLLGYYTLLAMDILKNGSQTTLYSKATDGLTTTSGSQSAADIGLLVRSVIDRYRTETSLPRIWYEGSYDIPNTSTTVTYSFQQKTYREAIDKLFALAPSGTYWYVSEQGRFSFKPMPTSATHTFVFGTHFAEVRVQRSLEKVRNIALVWDGDPSGTYTHYEDAASIALYGRRAEAVQDYGIDDVNAADVLGAKFLAQNSAAEVKVTCTIIDNNGGDKGYDIESINPGDTCRVVGFSTSLSDIFNDNMLITSVNYYLDRVEIEIELTKSGLLDLQAQQGQDISDISSGGLGVPESYS